MNYLVLLKGVEYNVVDIKKESIWDYVDKIKDEAGTVLGYRLRQNIAYFSSRYGEYIGAEKGDRSDGATDGNIGIVTIKVPDLDSFGWIFHDELCSDGVFEDGTVCNNWQASNVLSDIMITEGYWFRARTWFWATWSMGGDEARKNGMF